VSHARQPLTLESAQLIEDRARALAFTPVSRETLERLDRLVERLLDRGAQTNLVARSTMPTLWTRHVADSLQLLPLAPDARIWVDLGSGAGFPGLVIACALVEDSRSMVHLVESNRKKCAFLQEAIQATGVRALVHRQRIEEFTKGFRENVDVVTARALAPLEILLYYVHPLLKAGTIALLPKGQDIEAEMAKAARSWCIDAELVPSRTNPQSRILVVRGLKRLR
jgi:16S rRNA (guanine527-N7)-methyltransferase